MTEQEMAGFFNLGTLSTEDRREEQVGDGDFKRMFFAWVFKFCLPFDSPTLITQRAAHGLSIKLLMREHPLVDSPGTSTQLM